MENEQGSALGPSAERFWGVVGLLGLAYVLAWLTTLGASLTHDEAVYVDVARRWFGTVFYPEDTFLRHPPLGLALLAGWDSLGLPLRAWPAAWSLGGLALLAFGIRHRGGSPAWLAPVALAAPVTVPLLTVTLYPPLFFFLCLAAWGWATERRIVELGAWNLAVFTHELALLLLAVLLGVRAVGYLRRGISDVQRWSRLVVPYPAALVWGAIMLFQVVAVGDDRAGYVSTLTDPSPNVAAIVVLTLWVGVVILATVAPYLSDPRGDSEVGQALTLAAAAAILLAPFHRYVVTLIPALAMLRAGDPPAWLRRWGAAPILAACVVSSGLALGAVATGEDSLNAANLPGLVDHEEAASLVRPGEEVVVRSSPSFAWVLADEGWRITGTDPTGPATLELSRGEERIVLHRAETFQRLHELDRVDAVIFPAGWDELDEELPGEGWHRVDEAGGAARWEPV